MSVQNSVRSYLGIAKETTKGTAVTPTAFIPVAVGKLKTADIIDPLMDEGLRGSLVKDYNYVQGRKRSTVEWGGPVFPDTIPWAIAGILGSVATVGASAPYTHTISLKNASATAADAQPTAFTLTDFYAANVRAYAGCQIHDFGFTFTADGLLDYDAKATGWASATASTPTPAFSTVLPTPVWQGAVTVGGTTISNTVDGSLSLARPVTPIYGISTTQNPYSIFLGALAVTGTATFVMEDDTQLTNFLSNTQPALTFTWATGSGASATSIGVTVTKGAYTAAVIERSADYVTVKVDFTGIANTTDAGSTGGFAPAKFVISNAVTSGTYQ
jgi:Phage tail tube protein